MANKKVQKAGKAAADRPLQPVCHAAHRGRGSAPRTSSQAYESAREAYRQLSNGKDPSRSSTTRSCRSTSSEAAGNVRDVSVALHEARKKQKKGGGFGSPAARHRRGRGRARRVREPAQEGARRAVRRRGGVRVHLDDLVTAQYARRHGGLIELRGRPAGALFRKVRPPWRSTGSASAATCSAGRPTATPRSRCSTPTSRRAATSSTPPTPTCARTWAARRRSSATGWRRAATATRS